MEVVETTRLEELEAVIERGQTGFLEVGSALMEIRDSKLYKNSYATFDAYCQERWGFKRARGYQLMAAAKMSTTVDKPIQNERQARAISRPSPKPPSAARILPDYLDPEANDNGRTQLVEWYNQGRKVLQLLEDGGEITPRSDEDKASLLNDANDMIQIAQTVKRRLK